MSYGRPFRGLATPRYPSKWLGILVAKTSPGASEEVELCLSQLEKPAAHPWLGVCSPQSVIFLHKTIKEEPRSRQGLGNMARIIVPTLGTKMVVDRPSVWHDGQPTIPTLLQVFRRLVSRRPLKQGNSGNAWLGL